jgi:hypothetical protein
MEDAPEVRRPPRAESDHADRLRARWIALAGVSLMALVAVVGMWAPWRDEPVVDQDRSASPVVSGPTTSVLTADGPIAPLIGEPVPSTDAANLLRPALVAKIDAATAAMPQAALEQADVVVELRVEGISRYMAVWHSSAPETVGPVRSARTSDPDLLGLFGFPLFAFSGANDTTLEVLRDAGGHQDVSHDAAEQAYRRDRRRAAPHDLMADAGALWSRAGEQVVAPSPLFGYRAAGAPASGEAVPGVRASAGSEVAWVWDAQRRGWLRWVHGEPHLDGSGLQLAPTDVVVIETDYVASRADRTSPEAVSLGEGRAWLLSDGRLEEGTWSRRRRDDPWELLGADGSPMELEAGRSWVMLASGPPSVLDAEGVASLPRP